MTWTLSEFLSLLDLDGRTWCIVDISSAGGIRMPPNDSVYFYAVLHGSCRVAGVTDVPLEMHAGDACIILSGQAHAIRTDVDSPVSPVDFLCEEHDVDTPP